MIVGPFAHLTVAKLRVKTAVPFSERPRIAAASACTRARSTIRCNPSLRSYNRLGEQHAGRPVRASVRERAASKFAHVSRTLRNATSPSLAACQIRDAAELTFFFLRRDEKERTKETERERERERERKGYTRYTSQQRIASRCAWIRRRFISRTLRHIVIRW